MMTCGHSPNGKDMETEKPVCVICNCDTVGEDPDLLTRVAQCGICGEKQESKLDLPFFEYRPNELTDRFYNGCLGWD